MLGRKFCGNGNSDEDNRRLAVIEVPHLQKSAINVRSQTFPIPGILYLFEPLME